MAEIKIKCPAKINLTLEVLNKREDGFHNIQSVMQTIDLYDFLTIRLEDNADFEINLSGTSEEIPYDKTNLVYKAVKSYFDALNSDKKYKVNVYIEKNIPIAAGLAGGSADAAGVLFGLNELLNSALSNDKVHAICASLGSDLNFCLEGGCQLATSRGEILEKLPFCQFSLSLIKPVGIGISAKEAYVSFANLEEKPNLNKTAELKALLLSGVCTGEDVKLHLHNDLEYGIINNYKTLGLIKESYPDSIMSGSGSTFFALREKIDCPDETFWCKRGLKSIPKGVSIA